MISPIRQIHALEILDSRGTPTLRVNVQLVDAETGIGLWSERFDMPITELFEMQDEIVSRLANRLGPELMPAEARRAERSAHPDSMDHYFLGLGLYHRNGIEFLHQGRTHFDRAGWVVVKLDSP